MTILGSSVASPEVRRTTYHGLAGLEGGDGSSTVLLVPGFTGSKEDFLPLLAPLAREGFRVVSLDQRGQHESTGPADPAAYTIDALAADVRSVVGALGGPVHMLGHSFGGLVVRAAVLADISVAASLTLLGSGPAAIVGPRQEALVAMCHVFDRGGMPAVWAILRAADERPLPVQELAFLHRRFFASSPVGLRTMCEQLLTERDRVAELAALGLPLLVAHGEGDDAWPPQLQSDMARRLGARYLVIPGALHSPAVEAPVATVNAIVAFWRDVEEDRAA